MTNSQIRNTVYKAQRPPRSPWLVLSVFLMLGAAIAAVGFWYAIGI